jgi:uncharacterized protein (TIGR03083 family)
MLSAMPSVSQENVVDLVVAEIDAMASMCRGVDPETPVPTCPEWDLAELMTHTGTVHRWAATMVERSSQQRLAREDMDWARPDDPTALADWLAEGAEFVAGRFRTADPSTPMWAWGWPKTAGFWPRRMLHETGIHAADAALAVGTRPVLDPEIAADGVSELLDNLPHAAYFAPRVADLKGSGETLAFVATDLDSGWRITLEAGGFRWVPDDRAGADATATLETTAGGLLLTLYGRRSIGDGEVSGDRSLVERWIENSSL